MTINFFEPDAIPQPQEKVKIERLDSSVYEDRWRVRITIHVTPFRVRPNLAVVLLTQEGHLAAELSVIETMHAKMEFTLHIRGLSDPAGNYILRVRLYYGEDLHTPFDEQEHKFTIAETEQQNAG
ncbi:MAG: hypothetical protein K8I82_03925 [Anaerolineae bacterium]|nr:hypothetical protein [Anaerolineae bacterium]